MNLRKLFHITTADQSLIIFNETKLIDKRINDIANTERKEQVENQKSRDGRCPRCRASITVGDEPNIVDRIASVESKTKIRGNVFKINGLVVVETKPVNHCNNCGHEWEKFKTKVITDFAITKIMLDYLSDIIRNPEKNKRYSWKHEYMEVFKDCHAEAIYAVQKQYKQALRHPLTVRQLRTKYESIFDKKKSKS